MTYKTIRVGGKTKLEHRHVMEQLLGRPLLPEEQVHHKDERKRNNNPKNLELMPNAKAHGEEHAWDKEELIDLLIRYIDVYGKWPSWKEAISHPQMPHPSTFAKQFGTWVKAKEAAEKALDRINEEGYG